MRRLALFVHVLALDACGADPRPPELVEECLLLKTILETSLDDTFFDVVLLADAEPSWDIMTSKLGTTTEWLGERERFHYCLFGKSEDSAYTDSRFVFEAHDMGQVEKCGEKDCCIPLRDKAAILISGQLLSLQSGERVPLPVRPNPNMEESGSSDP